MVTRLILMRHAKSDWNHPGLQDHERPLNKRGRRSAEALGDWLREKGLHPDLALISSATRTMQTFEGLNLDCESRYLRELYHASAEAMRDAAQGPEAETVLMIGHNPGIAGFAAQIVSAPPSHPRFADYPTGATLVAGFSAETWAQANWREANTLDFVVPRDLPGM